MRRERIVDIHAHIWLGRAEADAELLRRAADTFGISAIFVSALGSHAPDRGEISTLNGLTARLVRSDSRFHGYVTVSPEQADSLEVLRRGAEEQGAEGMKLWVSCLCDDKRCDRLYSYCAENRLPVLVHTFAKTAGQLPGESTAVHLRRAALRHPDTRFIMAHLGGSCYHGLPLVTDLPNVWADFSGSTCRGDDLPYALERLGAERLLFGTDMPGSFVMSYGQVEAAELSAENRRLILYENARRLFRLRGGGTDEL